MISAPNENIPAAEVDAVLLRASHEAQCVQRQLELWGAAQTSTG